MGIFSFLRKPAKADSPVPTIYLSTKDDPKGERVSVTARAGDEERTLSLPTPKFNALPYTSIGALSKQVLYGAKGIGAYTTNHQVAFTTRTSAGAAFTASAVRQGDVVDATVVARHLFNKGTASFVLTSGGSAEVDITRTMADGLRTSLTTTVPPGPLTKAKDLSAQLGVEFGNEYIHTKGTASLDKEPVFKLSAATGAGQLQFGIDAAFSTSAARVSAKQAAGDAAAARADTSPATAAPSRKSAMGAAALVGGLTRWTAALGYKMQDHNLALHLSDAGASPAKLNAKLSYAAKLEDGILFGAEVSHDIPIEMKAGAGPFPPVSFVLGMEAKLSALQQAIARTVEEEDNNRTLNTTASPSALVKCKLDSTGKVWALYSDKLQLSDKEGTGAPALQVTYAASLDMVKPFAAYPKLGITLELV